MNNSNNQINRIWIISDTHFGIKNGDQHWINIAKQWRDEFLIPTIINNAKPGDYLFHLGDVFDKRTALDLNAINFTIETFEILSSIFYTLNPNNNQNNNSSNSFNNSFNNSLNFNDVQKLFTSKNNPKEFNNTILQKTNSNIPKLNINDIPNNISNTNPNNNPINYHNIKNSSNVKIIVGNHDLFRKHTNSINALNVLKWLPNIEIITENPKILNVGGKKGALIPWVTKTSDERNVINSLDGIHICFAHTSVQGAFYSGRRVVDHGLEKTDYDSFMRVYSGHIHTTQIAGKVKFVGNPFEMTRNDMGNRKFVLLIDFEREEEIEYENDVSPRWKRVTWETASKTNILEESSKRGDRLDIEISEDDMSSMEIRNFMSTAEDSGVEVLLLKENRTLEEEEDIILYDAQNTEIPNILEEEVNRRIKNEGTAKMMSKFLMDLYKRNL